MVNKRSSFKLERQALADAALSGRTSISQQMATTTPSVKEIYDIRKAVTVEIRRGEMRCQGTCTYIAPADPAWEELVARLKWEGIESLDFVRVVFHDIKDVIFPNGVPDTPLEIRRRGVVVKSIPQRIWQPPGATQLITDVRSYRQKIENGIEAARIQVFSESGRFKMFYPSTTTAWRPTNAEAIISTLEDVQAGLSSLFGYSLTHCSIKEPSISAAQAEANRIFRDARASYFADATVQFLGNVAGYSTVYRNRLPRNFEATARRDYRSMVDSIEL